MFIALHLLTLIGQVGTVLGHPLDIVKVRLQVARAGMPDAGS
jgi:hypothetical protein